MSTNVDMPRLWHANDFQLPVTSWQRQSLIGQNQVTHHGRNITMGDEVEVMMEQHYNGFFAAA